MSEIWACLNPGGRTISRIRGTSTRKRNRSRFQARLERLVETGHLRNVDGVYELGALFGTTMVIYVGRAKLYTAVFDAAGTSLDQKIEAYVRDTRREELPRLLRASISQLADMMRSRRWEAAGHPRAIALGLPAALSPDGEHVASDDPRGWKTPPLPRALEDAWNDERKRKPDLPELPRVGDRFSPLAVSIDTDVVMDTIGAMYERPTTQGDHYPAVALSVMGVKCSGGVRSTLITRGPQLNLAGEGPVTSRRPGDRRDSVFRGRYGDTVGLGHSIALIHRAARSESGGGDSVTAYWERLCESSHHCSCGSATVPHLESFASHEAVAKRLGVPPDRLDDVLRATIDDGDDAGGDTIDLDTLRETGRLIGYALDTGVRLYDPEAVFLTGGVSYSNVVWQAIEETADVARSERRSLVRVADLDTDDTTDPIGLRGGARLAADTWIYPAVLAPRGRTRTDLPPDVLEALTPATDKVVERRAKRPRQKPVERPDSRREASDRPLAEPEGGE